MAPRVLIIPLVFLLVLATVVLGGCSRPRREVRPANIMLSLRPGETAVSVELRERSEMAGLQVGMDVNVLAMPADGRGGVVLVVPGRIVAMNIERRTVVVSVPSSQASNLASRLRVGWAMVAAQAGDAPPAVR